MTTHPNIDWRRKDRAGQDIWRLRVSAGTDPISGRRRRLTKQFAGTITAAVKEQRRWQSETDRGMIRTGLDVTVADILNGYLRAGPALGWSVATAAEHRRYITKHLIPYLGRYKAVDLEVAHVREWRDLMLNGDPAGKLDAAQPATVKRRLVVLRAALAMYVQPSGPLLYNVASVVELDVPKKRFTVPSDKTVRQVLDRARTADPDLYAFLRLTAAAGERRGEGGALRRSDVDFERGLVTVAAAVAYGGRGVGLVVQDRTKVDRDRQVLLDAETVRILREYDLRLQQHFLALGVRLTGDHYLFPNPDNPTRPMHPTSLSRKVRLLCEEVGVKVTLQELRKFVTTQLVDRFGTGAAVADRQGHGPQTMLGYYAAPLDETSRRVADHLGGLLGPG